MVLSFVERTGIITGASGALGKAYARDLAKRGCNLLLNDIPAAAQPLDDLVKEIRMGGGKVVANHDCIVDGGTEIVNAALHAFNGKCDIVINNAGNLIDRSFAKMSKEDWHAVLRVHLYGSFSLSHAAWPIMQKQQYGRIVNIGSGAGLYGNFGQANYSSAKMGIIGLTNTLAKEGEKYNIGVNCVIPVAKSKMTENLLSPEILDLLAPEQVAPIVTLLAHESNKGSGECFEVGGGWFSKIRLQRSEGVFISNDIISAEQLSKNMQVMRDFSANVTYPNNAADAMQAMILAKEKNANGLSNVSIAVNKENEISSKEASSSTKTPFPSDSMFESLQNFILQNTAKAAEISAKVRANVLFKINLKSTKQTKYWLLQMKAGTPPSLTSIDEIEATGSKVNVTLICEDETIIALLKGSLSPEFAYMRRLLQIDGQMGAALKIKSLLEFSKTLK